MSSRKSNLVEKSQKFSSWCWYESLTRSSGAPEWGYGCPDAESSVTGEAAPANLRRRPPSTGFAGRHSRLTNTHPERNTQQTQT